MCAFTGNYFPVLMRGAAQIEEAAMQLKMLFMTPEERAKQELIIQNKKDIIAQRKKDAAYKKQLDEYSQKDRQAKAADPVRESKGNQLKFGANVVKFEPPKNQGG